MEAGFRETGAVSLLARRLDEGATPIVAVRSMGLSFESLVGFADDTERYCVVSTGYLAKLMQMANERFVENQIRIARFQAALKTAFEPPTAEEWEDAETRRRRKRAEGLRRREELRRQNKPQEDHVAGGLQPSPELENLIFQQLDVL